jgi:hypothetical protein
MASESESLRRFARHPAGPTILALALALVALPVVAASLQAYDISRDTSGDAGLLPLDAPGRWTAAAGSVLLAALVGGTAGGFLRGRIHNCEILVVGLSWIVGIAAAPLGPYLFHQQVGFERFCLDSCGVSIQATDPSVGLAAVVLSPLGLFVEGCSFLALLIGVLLWTAFLRQYAPVSVPRPVPPMPPAPPPIAIAAATPAPGRVGSIAGRISLPPWVAGSLRALACHPLGPTVLAVGLALVALPLVAVTLQLYQPSSVEDWTIYPLPALHPARWAAATGGVFASALVAGTIGRWWRMKMDYPGLATFIIAWLVAVAATPVLPALLGMRVGLESSCNQDSGVCGVWGHTGDPGVGLSLLPFSPVGPSNEPVSFLALGVGVWLWWRVMVRFGPPVPPRTAQPQWQVWPPPQR